jgi:membrane protease subunit HflK
MEQILPNIEKVIIDGKGGDRLVPYLPLDRLSKPAPKPAGEEPQP